MTSDLDTRAIKAAPHCETLVKLARALNVDFQVAVGLNDRLGLGLEIQRKDRKPSDWVRKPIPKPRKGGKE